MKKISLFLLLVIFLTACSDDQATPNDRFEAFVNDWNGQNYEQMYGFFSNEAKETFSATDSVERTQNVYEDIGATNIEIAFEPIEEEAIEVAFEEGSATIPFSVGMETIAGPISFDYEATLTLEGEEEEKNWFINWDSGFIFPEIKDGAEIRFSTTTPTRGVIFDRNEMPLALNDEIFEVGIVPEKMTGDVEQSKKKIANLLGMSVESIDKKLNASWVEPDLNVPIATITKTDEALINSLVEVGGIGLRTTTGRIYPAGEAAAHLVGYLRTIQADDFETFEESKYGANDLIGARGLERLYEEQLKGEQGIKIYVSNGNEDDEITLAEKPVKHGENIRLTIDINVQEKLFNSYQDDAGTAAAINPKTGETLALVSSPSFDPNEILYGTSADIWEKWDNDEDQPLINRIVTPVAPGSAFKPITAAIGLHNGTIDPNEGFEINGLTWSKGPEWGDYEVTRVSTSNGPVDLKDALIRSDNIYFAMQAVEMGADAFVSGLEQFGFGADFPYSYAVTASSISNSGNLDDELLLANTSYGQGEILMTAIHLATAYTSFLNDGNMIKPTFLASEETAQVLQEGLITPEQVDIIQDALRAVVTDGTAKKAQAADFPISGKTGTVELKQTLDESGEENSWFVAYPTDDQDILIAMQVEDTHNKESGLAVQKVTDVLMDYKK
ncbi:penicillin-binding transpeptidase domain-containing protein [Oceanobacillus bengalensis]|uniref:penicillin-binding transpeptidase domain-containing protein n=1 Tax=Oceanobacillus bengalensis TaxID=1435466 RepID=UPI00160044F6|nr:penicillin-binding transpeptidase domain-containing protein [Oceanobacillus bengalensis]